MSYIWEKRPRIERYIYDSLSYLRDAVSSAEKITPMIPIQTAAKRPKCVVAATSPTEILKSQLAVRLTVFSGGRANFAEFWGMCTRGLSLQVLVKILVIQFTTRCTTLDCCRADF